MGEFDDLIVADAPAAGKAAGAFDDLVPAALKRGEFEDLVPTPKNEDRTLGSQLAVKVPEVMSEWGVEFPKEMPGLSASEVETLNSLKRDVVLKEAKRRVVESPARAIARGTLQTVAGAAESMRDPATLGAIALTPIAPEVPAVLFGYLGAKTVGEGAGELSVPGNLDTAGATRKMLEMGLMTAGARGSAEALLKSYKPRVPLKPAPPATAVSEFGGLPEAETPPPSSQPGVENAVPGANVSDVSEAKAPEPELLKVSSPEAAVPETPINQTSVEGAPVLRVKAGEIATRPDLMQFKRMDEPASGVNAQDKLQGKWDDLKAGNLLLWEPQDPAAHGLEPGQKYIVANGHHRFEFGTREGIGEYNAQVIKESEGYGAGDARALAAEINIADGKGTIYDQVKFLRNESATHGADEAMARAGRISIKGRQAATIAFQAGPDLYDSFVNERIRPEQAEAIAKAAPIGGEELSAGLQRMGVRRALEGAGPQELQNLIQAVRLENKGQTAEQFDLFGADDTAMQTAEQLAKVASRIQGELSREIRATEAAAKNAETAKAKGVRFERPPEEILAENQRLKAERERWDNWALHPDLVKQVRDYAEMMRAQKSQTGHTPKEQDPVVNWLDKAIGATDPLNRSRTLEGVLGAPVWLAKSAAHAALQVTRAAYLSTRNLAQAIAAGIEHLRGLKLEGFDESEARTWLESSLGVRQRAERIEAGDASEPVKTAVAGEAIYQVRPMEQIQGEARQLVNERGEDAALELFKNPNSGLPLDTRTALGAELEQRFRTAERVARASGDTTQAEALAQKQVDLWKADAYGTQLAQGLNARKLYDGLSAAGKLQQARDLFDEAAQNELERQKPAIETVKQAIEQGRADAVEAVRQDPATNEAARKAVDETVAGSAETHRAIVMDMAEPWAQSSAILEHARAAVRAKADELLNRGPKPPGLTPAARLREILDDLAQRAAGIAAGHYQGAEPTVPLAEKLVQRLGIGKEQAARLAKQLDAEWSKQVEAAKKALPKRLAKARAANAGGLTTESTDDQVDAALRKQLQQLNVKMGKVLVDEAGRRDATGKSVAERIIQTSGLTGPAADALRVRLEARWADLLKRAAQQRLEAMERGGAVVSRKMRGMFDDLVDLNRLGAMTDERFQGVVRKKLDLPEMDDRLAREIVRRANDLEKLPEGDLRTRGATDLLNFVTRQRGLRWSEMPLAIYISNLLAGVKTPAKILFENGTLMVAQTLATLRNPTMLAHPWELVGKPALRGVGRGLLQSAEVLRSGTVTGVRGGELVRAASILEQRPLGKYDWLNIWKWPLRAVAAAHVPLFKPTWEMKQTAIAAKVAKAEGLRGQALTQRVADLMGQTEERVAAARNAARAELQNAGYFQPRQPAESLLRYERRTAREKLDYTRRVGEIITQGREQSMPGSTEMTRNHALHYTYLGKPYGFIGYVGEMVRNGIERGRAEKPLYSTIVKSQVPFTTVASNIINEHLNWTPVGTARAIRSHFTNELYGRPLVDADARADLYARSIAGTVLAYGAAQLVAQGIIKLNGPGPAAPQAKKQWRDAGNEPFSVEVNGRRYSYMNTPWASSLAVLGAWNDWTKFGKGEEADANTRLAFALKATMSQALSLPMLTGVRDFLEATTQSTGTGGNQLEKLMARTASTAVFPKWLRDVDQAFDPKLYDQTGMGALLASQVPFVRRENRPVLNRLGEPVERGVWSSWTGKPDQVWRTIVEKNAFIPEPSRNQVVGDKKRGPDHYRAITPDELYDLVADTGPRIRARLERALESGTAVGDTIYPPLTIAEPWQAQAVVHHIAQEEEAKAKARLRF